MIIQSIRVKNYRSIRDASLSCDALTALVGRNGSGKSSFLSALELFYEPAARVTQEDFYANDVTSDIEITVTFSDLTLEEEAFFSTYMANSILSVTRVFSGESIGRPGSYHGSRLQHSGFAGIRAAGPRRESLAEYRKLRETAEYESLPSVRSAADVDSAIATWESEHPDELVLMRDDGHFFGFTNVAQGYLGRHTRFIRIPAVRDASEDAAEGRGSSITEIMDLVVRSVLGSRDDVAAFKESTQTAYRELLDPASLTELETLEQQLTGTLAQYVPDAGVSLNWSALPELTVPMPQAQVRLREDSYESAVERAGHGLQRALVLTMLQHLVAARERGRVATAGADTGDPSPGDRGASFPNLVLAIDEPELYQHPSRQRHMATVLLKLAEGEVPGVAERTQVIYTTHAPLFVGLDRFDQVRVLRKVSREPGRPKMTEVSVASLEAVARELWELGGRRGDEFTPDSLRARMQGVMTPWMNEGFFADLVVLVEGEGDQAAIQAVAELLGHDLSAQGIAVVPCRGKTQLDRPAVVFRQLGIQSYVIWDNDRPGGKTEENRALLRLVRAEEEDWPAGVWEAHACLDGNLESLLREEITPPIFDQAVTKASAAHQIGAAHASKNPLILSTVIRAADALGGRSHTLRGIVERIVALRSRV